jgi:saccharopine dehydrogenase (NAD+, L-lysine-forming)
MARVTVLGGCGAVGSVVVKTLVKHPEFSEVVIADFNINKARAMAKAARGKKVKAASFDALKGPSVKAVIRGSDVVVNCVGPFYSTVKPVLTAVIQSGINYLDVCDDVDVTLDILKMDGAARKAKISAVIGMGSSPGVTNLLGKLAADDLLDETDSIDIFHAHGGEPVEGAGVIGHRFHCMSIDIPMYLDGRLQYVKYFEPSGIALREKFKFPVLGEVPLFPYPHPEQITMPRYIKCRRVTHKGSLLPIEYYTLTAEMCRLGLSSPSPIEVKGCKVRPYDFAISYILRERERILKATRFGKQRGCVSVIVKGRKRGASREYRFHMASASQALGEGTGIPAAAAAILMSRGKISARGVLPPEGCIRPSDFVALVPEVFDLKKAARKGDSFSGFMVESVDEFGKVTRVDI